MADVVVTIQISALSYTSWLRTSYVASAIKAEDGTPLIVSNELGPDQVDAFNDFIEEASREVNKLYISRQGDVAGVPFEYTPGTTVIYRFNEQSPVLSQASSIKESLTQDTKTALFTYVTMLWYKLKGHDTQVDILMGKFESLKPDITGALHRLHD